MKQTALKRDGMYPEKKRIANNFKLIPQTELETDDDEEKDIPDEDDQSFQLDEYYCGAL